MQTYPKTQGRLKNTMNILDSIASYPVEKLSKCSDQGCCIGLDGITKRIIFKGEFLVHHVLQQQRKACDCFIFTIDGMLVIALVELKSKTLNLDKVKEKLDNSATVVELILEKYNITKNYDIIPILLAKSFNKKPSNNPKARRFRIQTRKGSISIIPGPCGKQLASIINQ